MESEYTIQKDRFIGNLVIFGNETDFIYRKKVYFRSQILECKCQAILEHDCDPVLAIGQYCHVLDFINITDVGNITIKMFQYHWILEYSSIISY